MREGGAQDKCEEIVTFKVLSLKTPSAYGTYHSLRFRYASPKYDSTSVVFRGRWVGARVAIVG